MSNALLAQALQKNAISLPDASQKKLLHYVELLQTWNRVFNLTTLMETQDIIYLHLIDSLVVSPYLEGKHLLDVGSGAGLPGIPLALLNPHQEWVLLDKNNKKTRFLTQVIAELDLKNVEIVHASALDFHPGFCFDSILTRAFGTIRLFVEATKHLLSASGVFIAMKGHYPQKELEEIPPPCFVQDVIRLNLKGVDVERHVARLRIKD